MANYQNSNHNNHIAAETYHARDWSVIPCQPNTKIAAVSWKLYQLHRVNPLQFITWFANPHTNLAIVTGRVSKLIVLDIDDEAIYRLFVQLFPHLTATRIVKSPDGWHFYFAIPTYLNIPSRKSKGVDLLAEGSYVLAPPSVVDGKAYTLIQGGAPLAIDGGDISSLQAFLDRFSGNAISSTQSPEKPRKAPLSASERHSRTRLSLSGLKYRYLHLTPTEGRNNALFRAACLGRDLGYTQSQVRQALVEAHVHQPANGDHPRESEAARRREAQRTIASAFSRAPRPLRDPAPVIQLTNALREYLLKHKLMGVLRVIEGLRLLGIEPGDLFCRKDALRLLEGIVGRDTVYNAINAEINGVRIFAETPPDPPGLRCIADMSNASQNMRFDGVTKSGIVFFRMPSNTELCQMLGVATNRLSDELTLDDLRSVKTVRQALNNRLFQRRPGPYSRKLLAARLNVSIRSTQRYTKADPNVRITPVFTAEYVTWGNYQTVIPPAEFKDEGEFAKCFLVDQWGQRYPAKQALAQVLLAQKKTLYLYWQRPNHYRYAPVVYSRAAAPEAAPQQRTWLIPPADRIEPIVEYVACRQPAIVDATTQEPLPGMNVPTKSPKKVGGAGQKQTPEHVPKKRKISGKRKLKDPAAEHLAQHVYKTINEMTERVEDRMSLRSARLMVHNYGIPDVKWALKRVQSRQSVRKPVGLLSTILRSEKKFGK